MSTKIRNRKTARRQQAERFTEPERGTEGSRYRKETVGAEEDPGKMWKLEMTVGEGQAQKSRGSKSNSSAPEKRTREAGSGALRGPKSPPKLVLSTFTEEPGRS